MMAFLFKSRKHQQNSGLPTSKNHPPPPDASQHNTPPPTTPPNAVKDRDGGNNAQGPTPGSYNATPLSSIPSSGSSQDLQRMRPRAESGSQSPRQQLMMNGNAPNAAANSSLYPWSQRRLNFSPQGNPFPRYGAAINAVASKDGDIYMMGGLIDGSTVKGDIWKVESNNLSCTPIATVAEGPGPRVGHASLLVGNAFIVFGGDTKIDENDSLDDTLYLLNISSRQWSRSLPPGPRPAGRYGHTLNILGSKLYVFGGQVEGYFFNDLVAFDLNQLQNPANRWEFLVRNSHEGGPPPGQIPPARTNHTMVTFNDKLYLFGGTNGLQWFHDVWSYDPRTNTWTQMDCVGYIPVPREGHAATLVNDVMYIFGGRTDEGIDLGDLAAFRISTRRWYSFQNMGPAPSPRSGHSMTACGRHIVVMAGEPSSAPREPTELSMVYILDTSKIRYPVEQQSGDRNPAGRKASVDKFGAPAGRASRQAQMTPPDQRPQQQGRPPAATRESVMTGPASRPVEIGPGSGPSPGPGSRLPRASIAQTPSGPPPPGQAPTPGPRGPLPQPGIYPRTKTPPRMDRGYAPSVDTVRAVSLEKERDSPISKDSPKDPRQIQDQNQSPASSGRPTPVQQHPRLAAKAMEAGEAAPLMSGPTRQRSLRHQRQRSSLDSADDSVGKRASLEGSIEYRSHRNSRSMADDSRSPRLTAHHEALTKELDTAKSRNAWYATELALAKKAGYAPNPSNLPSVDERSADTFAETDRPVIEAFIAMKSELAKMQSAVDRQAAVTSKRVAEVEHQRDAALSEAAYARTKLAAHGGSLRGTPPPGGSPRDFDEVSSERNIDISRRLAVTLASQNELKSKMEAISVELEQEKRARELAEDTSEATRKRLAELSMQTNALEMESLRGELHQLEASVRQQTLLRTEAETSVKQLIIDKEELTQKLEDSSTRLKDHGNNLGALREAVAASTAKAELIEKQLEEEREIREGLERKLLQLRSEHEERTSELENVSRRLRDAEELGVHHAREAEAHKTAFLSGLDRASSFDSDDSARSFADQRVGVLEAQVEKANSLAKANQAAADESVDRLRRAEERIAGLEAYQEQASREGLHLRRQLQSTMKESQALVAENRDLKSQLDNQQRNTGIITAQHSALKDILGERGASAADSRRSPRLDSPGSRFGTPEQSRLRELEQQLSVNLKAHEEMKASFESREQEADRAYREKLEQLETDYQSAVHYVKGTEKMLKRMKDELTRYKAQNAKVQSELETVQESLGRSSASGGRPADWEVERSTLQKAISDIQQDTSVSLRGLDQQIAKMKEELAAAQAEKHRDLAQYESSRKELAAAAEKSREELEQLKNENSLLETRAMDAEQKVSMLLDQVETSVGNYRRQSHLHSVNGISRSQSNASSNTISGTSTRQRADSAVSHDDTFLDNRSSVALDSLASELETLRNHWENTNRNYRLSSQLDLERTPTRDTIETGGLSDSVADWRRRLDEEEEEARIGSPAGANMDKNKF